MVKVGKKLQKKLPGQTLKQCHDRYANYLRDGLKSEPWTQEEDEMLIEMHKEIGPKWVKMMKRLPGRSGNDIKNRWHKHLIKKEKLISNSQIKNFDQKVNMGYNQYINEQSNMAEKLVAARLFIIEPVFGNNYQTQKVPADSNPNIKLTRKTMIINNPPPNNHSKKTG